MIKLGKYRIYFTNRFWLQTLKPVKWRKLLFMTILWDARSTDVDKKQKFALGTGMVEDGRVYRYYRARKCQKGGELTDNGEKE